MLRVGVWEFRIRGRGDEEDVFVRSGDVRGSCISRTRILSGLIDIAAPRDCGTGR
jgi:hypothetical protein